MTRETTCKWCHGPMTAQDAGRPLKFCSGRCRTADYRSRHRRSKKGMAAELVRSAARDDALAAWARETGTNDGLFVAEMLKRIAEKKRGTAGMVDHTELFS